MRGDVGLGPYEGRDDPAALARVLSLRGRILSLPGQHALRGRILSLPGHTLALSGQHAVHHETAGDVAEEEPAQEDTQYQGDHGDGQTFPRRGNRQQPVELFPIFLGVGNDIME